MSDPKWLKELEDYEADKARGASPAADRVPVRKKRRTIGPDDFNELARSTAFFRDDYNELSRDAAGYDEDAAAERRREG